jgi:hypothetical protein
MTLSQPTASTRAWERLREAMHKQLRAELKGKSKKQRREAVARAATMKLGVR